MNLILIKYFVHKTVLSYSFDFCTGLNLFRWTRMVFSQSPLLEIVYHLQMGTNRPPLTKHLNKFRLSQPQFITLQNATESFNKSRPPRTNNPQWRFLEFGEFQRQIPHSTFNLCSRFPLIELESVCCNYNNAYSTSQRRLDVVTRFTSPRWPPYCWND